MYRRRTIGARVREERVRLNLTQEQVVLAARIDRVTLRVMEIPLAALMD